MSPASGADEGWHRLDPRMLLVYPVRELIRFLPVVVGVLVAGNAAGGGTDWWHALGVAVPVALGLLRYLTTTYRVGADRVELRRGLVNRHLLSTPRDRVRSVDVTATATHRLLGLVTVRIGTGTASRDSDDDIRLDGLPAARVRDLRAELLRLAPDADSAPADDPVVLRLDPAWARYAPATSSGLVIAAGAIGAGSQAINTLGGFARLDGRALTDVAADWPLLVGAPVLVLVLLVAFAVVSVAGYLVANWGFTLTRTRAAGRGAWHVRRGLLTTRETSIDQGRVRGVVLAEPLGLRAAGAARATVIATGLRDEAATSALIAPPAPREVVAAVAGEVLGTRAPLTAPLVGHGPRARARRWSRALTLPLLATAADAVLTATSTVPAWTLAPVALVLGGAALIARDRAAGLGHALVAGHLVARSGSLDRQREVLAVPGVIGWRVRSTWFQRRAGLVSLSATMAGGPQSVTILDVPEDVALDLAHRALPGLLAPFLVSQAAPPASPEAPSL